jgi:hypothetical protein
LTSARASSAPSLREALAWSAIFKP